MPASGPFLALLALLAVPCRPAPAEGEAQALFEAVPAAVSGPILEHVNGAWGPSVRASIARIRCEVVQQLLLLARPGDTLRLRVPLDDYGASVVVRVRPRASPAAGTRAYVGEVDGEGVHGEVVLTWMPRTASCGLLAGRIASRETGLLLIQPAPPVGPGLPGAREELYVLREPEPLDRPDEGDHLPRLSGAAGGAEEPGAERTEDCGSTGTDERPVVQVVVAYTGDAKDGAGGAGPMAARILEAVTECDQALANAGVAADVTLLGTLEVEYDEEAEAEAHPDAYYETTWNRLVGSSYAAFDPVREARACADADVAFLVLDRFEYRGWGPILDTCAAGTLEASAERAYAVVHRESMATTLSMAHELGHVLGACHGTKTDPACPKPPLSSLGHGCSLKHPTTSWWSSVMMPAADGKRLVRFAYPTMAGDVGMTSSSCPGSDAASLLGLTAFQVATFGDLISPPTGDCSSVGIPFLDLEALAMNVPPPAGNGGPDPVPFTRVRYRNRTSNDVYVRLRTQDKNGHYEQRSLFGGNPVPPMAAGSAYRVEDLDPANAPTDVVTVWLQFTSVMTNGSPDIPATSPAASPPEGTYAQQATGEQTAPRTSTLTVP